MTRSSLLARAHGNASRPWPPSLFRDSFQSGQDFVLQLQREAERGDAFMLTGHAKANLTACECGSEWHCCKQCRLSGAALREASLRSAQDLLRVPEAV